VWWFDTGSSLDHAFHVSTWNRSWSTLPALPIPNASCSNFVVDRQGAPLLLCEYSSSPLELKELSYSPGTWQAFGDSSLKGIRGISNPLTQMGSDGLTVFLYSGTDVLGSGKPAVALKRLNQ
jgi:hypothetical protein